MKKDIGIQWRKSLIFTVILILLMLTLSISVVRWINYIEEDFSFEQLHGEAARAARDVQLYAQSDRDQLEMLAVLVAAYDNPASPELWRLLSSYETIGTMHDVALLLPDNTIITGSRQKINVEGRISFEEEAARGAHISNREASVTGTEDYVIRHYVPVIRNGKTTAMLYGVIRLNELPQTMSGTLGRKDAAIYLIDGKTGDFLLDTWHKSTGNIWELGEREMAPGYNHAQLKQRLTEGKTGHVVFVSQTTGEYLYFCFMPLAINDWRLAISVPEDTVFARAKSIRVVLDICLAVQALCFILYFLWILRYTKRQIAERQNRLDMLSHIYDVEKLLFNAHEQTPNIVLALEKIARITSAEKTAFWMIPQKEQGGTDSGFIWESGDGETPESATPFRANPARLNPAAMLDFFKHGHTYFETRDPDIIRRLTLTGTPEESIPKNLIAVPVEDPGIGICGALGAYNLPDDRVSTVLLKSMSFSFSMLCHNMRIYAAMKEQGEHDALTGLQNRNRYEADLAESWRSYPGSLACIYIDVNNLHELNNSQGHTAGDRMLKSIANQIRQTFGSEHTYRIGGDEFVVFVPEAGAEETARQCMQIKTDLAEKDFHISVGFHCGQGGPSLNELIKTAEEKMYDDKRKYYENTVHDRRQRNRPGAG